MTTSMTSVLILAGSSFAVYAIALCLKIGRRDSALPPGPPTVPLLGNLHMLPSDYMYLKLTEWARQYGGIFTLKMSAQNFIVVSDPRIEKILLERKSGSTSDRPPSYLVDLVTDGKHTAFARYGSDWRRSRKMLHEWFNKEACRDYTALHQAEVAQLLHDLFHEPERLTEHAFRYSNSLITSILAGIRSSRWDSPLVTIVRRMMRIWTIIAEPGVAASLDMIPILRVVPERWALWKTRTRVLRNVQQDMYDAIIRHCEGRITRKETYESLLEKVIPTLDDRGVDEALLRGIIASVFEGASGTSADFVRTCVFLMTAHPWVQKRAQDELDRVIGSSRAPTLEDYDNLPYCRAVVNEINRFRPVAPLTAPHRATQDEVVDGYHIPKGSTIIVNMYGIFHDPASFDDPEAFNPDRFLLNELGLKPGASDDGHRTDMCFGAGRRICGGIQIASNSQALVTINLLWAFNMENVVDTRTGEHIPLDLDNFISGLTTSPGPFEYSIRIRSPEHAKTIENNVESAKANVFCRLDEDGLPKEVFERLQQQIEVLS